MHVNGRLYLGIRYNQTLKLCVLLCFLCVIKSSLCAILQYM